MTTTQVSEATAVDAVALRVLLDGERREVREHVRAVLARPEFSKPDEPLPTEEYRRCSALRSSGAWGASATRSRPSRPWGSPTCRSS